MKYLKKITLILFFTNLFFSCNSIKTAVFDQYSLQKNIEIKVEAINLMDKATSSYRDNLQEIGEFSLEIKKILEYEKNKPNNEITYVMWQKLTDKDKNLMVGFFKRWQEKNKLNLFFIEETKAQIEEVMDLLIQYESKKDKQAEDKLLQLIKQ